MTCALRLVFSQLFLVKVEQIVTLTIKEEDYLVRQFRDDYPCVD